MVMRVERKLMPNLPPPAFSPGYAFLGLHLYRSAGFGRVEIKVS